jgi:hypothetical protein
MSERLQGRIFWQRCLVSALGVLLLGMMGSSCNGCGGSGSKPPPPPAKTPTPTPTTAPTATATASATATATATPTPAPNACLPSSSIAVLVQGTNVTAYVPSAGGWDEGTTTLNVVPIETASGTLPPATSITTPNPVNSCSSNSTTGQTVCVANNTDVYLITGSTLNTTLTSGATADESFSGGACENCGVVVDSTTNKALLEIGIDAATPGGYQYLDLGATPPAFETPISVGTGAFTYTSENIAIDPTRKLVLSPNEQGNYQLLNTSTSPATVFNNTTSAEAGLDSAAEDCTTGIALSAIENVVPPDDDAGLFITDLTQATFTPGSGGSAGTWTAPSQLESFPEFNDFAADTCGIAISPGTHLGIVTGEFGGNLEGVIELPSTSGSGTPAVVDYVSFLVPNDPAGTPWGQGLDPHTVTAYTSPNTGTAFAVLGEGNNAYLALVNLQGLLSAPRTGHVVNTPIPAGLITFVAQDPSGGAPAFVPTISPWDNFLPPR